MIQVVRKNLVCYYAKVRTAEWYRHTPQQLKQSKKNGPDIFLEGLDLIVFMNLLTGGLASFGKSNNYTPCLGKVLCAECHQVIEP